MMSTRPTKNIRARGHLARAARSLVWSLSADDQLHSDCNVGYSQRHGSGGVVLFKQIAARIKTGEIETHRSLDPRATVAYIVLLIGAAMAGGFVVFQRYRFSAPMLTLPPLWGLLLLSAGPLARRIGHSRIGGCCEATALIYCQGIAICAALPMLAAYSLPFADETLVKLDRAIGFDWLSFAMWLKDKATILTVMRAFYISFVWQPALVLILLFAFRHDDRAWRFVNAAAVALLLTVLIFPFLPARGGFEYFGITKAMYPNLDARTPWEFGDAIARMKSGTRLITPELMVGYVSFPSYHSASAALFSWAVWPLRRIRWMFVLLNVGMGASALIIGAHYLVDVIAGVAVGFGAIPIATAFLRLASTRHHFLTSITPISSA